MSRTATATPPPTYFPQRNATPTMRHAASSGISTIHFAARHRDHPPKKRTKNLPSSSMGKRDTGSEDGLGLSFEDIGPYQSTGNSSMEGSTASLDPLSIDPLRITGTDSDYMDQDAPTPAMTASTAGSYTTSALPTPPTSRASSLHQSESAFLECESTTPADTPSATARQAWMPFLGQMAKAVVANGFGKASAEKLSIDARAANQTLADAGADSQKRGNTSPRSEAIFVPIGPSPRPTREEMAGLTPEQALEKKRTWALAEQKRVTECARLCSQWPHSGYNQSKWGPNGSRNFYEPQSYANPGHVASLMAKQADLERTLYERSALVFTCRQSRASSEESDPSDDSWESSAPSPSASMCLTADISAAMGSPLISANSLNASQVSLDTTDSAEFGVKSLPEINAGAQGGEANSTTMDIDQDATSTRPPVLVRPARAQSCGAKRPMTAGADEEDKRRKVDEAMVVEEAVNTGVIIPGEVRLSPPQFTARAMLGGRSMSASVPNLSPTKAAGAAIFGHVVKTSDTHPIIISPFFPTEIIAPIADAIVIPAKGLVASPLQLGSKIDVPSLLLSQQTPAASKSLSIVPSPVKPAFDMVEGSQYGIKLGNLLLSSCPGKRLRMEGPVKGRGPVCRDLATDLRRIKSEGVGCLVCCLDDSELALLGVPWETYSQVALDIGLDVIRVPMPDGFTPVSLSLFDDQVSLIVRDYSLKGVNVLVHCRGGVGRAGLTASAWAIKMGFVPPHPSLALVEEAAVRQAQAVSITPVSPSSVQLPAELEHQIVMSIVERVIAMIRARRGLKAIESAEQVQFLASYVGWLRSCVRESSRSVA